MTAIPSQGSARLTVVVGGGQGIGAEIARALAGRGDRVVIASRNQGQLSETASAIEADGGWVRPARVDLSEPDDIASFGAKVVEEHGSPTVLVNAGGNSLSSPALDVTPEEWDLVLDVHLKGTFFTSQVFAPHMAAAEYGKILNLSSTWAATVTPGRSVYAAAKAGVSHLTAALAVEWAPLGIRVNALAPGFTLTPRTRALLDERPDRLGYHLERIPLGRMAQAEDLAGAALFLTSGESDFITGHTLYVDGGFHVAR